MKRHIYNVFKLKCFLWLVAFYFLLSGLHFVYMIHYDDFKYVSFTQGIEFYFYWPRYMVATVIILAQFILLLYSKVSDFLYGILLLILVFFVIPSGLLFSSNKTLNPGIFLMHNLFFILVYLFSFIKWNLTFPRINNYQSMILLISISVVGLIPFIVLYGPYLDIRNLWLVNVYETRALVLAKVHNLYTAYTYSWFAKIVIPTSLVFCIYFRKKTLFLISVMSLLFLYLCGAHKTVFYGTFFMVIFYKYEYLKKMAFFMKLMTLFLTLTIVATLFFDFSILWELSFRRALMLSALLDYCYFDFFNHNYIYWSDSFLSGLIHYPYDITPDFIIGRDYFNRPTINANVGIISDGFKNAGYYGTIINIVIVALIFSFLNSLKISPKFFGLFILFLFTLLNSSLTTILLTHGGGLMLLVAMFLLRNTETTLK